MGAQPTVVDSVNCVASAQVDHFSGFQLGDGSAPSETFVPQVQGWQVGLFSGNASFSYPIEVPAGPAGIKPDLQLSYNSASTDGKVGMRLRQQAGWVGKGWSLDTGTVSANKDGAGVLLALTNYAYDGNTIPWGTLSKGDLTLVRKYYDLTPGYVYGTTTIHSADTSYTYDRMASNRH